MFQKVCNNRTNIYLLTNVFFCFCFYKLTPIKSLQVDV